MKIVVHRRAGFVAACAALVLGLGVAGAIAQDVVQQRKDLMKSNGAAMRAIGDIVKAGGTLDAAAIADKAAIVRANATKIVALFPAGSTSDRALPAIWEKPDEFKDWAMKLGTAAAALEQAAKGNTLGDGKALVGAVGGGCGGCHKSFQKPAS